MALSILNNIPSLEAQNQLAITTNKLKDTLFQLSTGSKINSGADDPAGLAIADSLQANIQALTQSAQNVSNGVGLLQTADGALSQVTTLLNRAVTLAAEAANTGLTPDQQKALQNEFASITSEIDQIGSNTTYNNTAVFSGSAMSVFLSDGSAADSADPNISVNMPTLSSSSLGLASYATGTLDLTANPTAGNTVTIGATTYTFVTGQAKNANEVAIDSTSVQNTLSNLKAAVNGGPGAGSAYGTGTAVNSQATITSVNGGSAVVQSLTAGAAGNNVTLTTSLSTNVGSAGSATLTGGVDKTYDTATLTLTGNPTLDTAATGALTMTALPDWATNATGILNMALKTGTAAQPTAAVNATATLDLNAGQPTAGNATGTITFGAGAGTVPSANDTVSIGTTTYKFVTAFDGGANEVMIDTMPNTLRNLKDAVNGVNTSGQAGSEYSIGTVANNQGQITNIGAASGGNTIVTAMATKTGTSGEITLAKSGAAIAASGAMTNGGTGDIITVGGTAYTFVAQNMALGLSGGNEVALGTDQQATLNNLKAALNGGTADPTKFALTNINPNTNANANAKLTTIGGANNFVATFTSKVAGAAGNTTGTGISASGTIANDTTAFGGGTDGDSVTVGAQAYSFVAYGQAYQANEIAVDSTTINQTLTNLMNAVNGTGTASAGINNFAASSSRAGNAFMTVNGTTATFTATTGGAGVSGAGNAALDTGNNVTFTTSTGLSADLGPATGKLGGGQNGDTVVIGSESGGAANTYTFVAAGQAVNANQVSVVTSNALQADNINATLTNLMEAVNGTAGTSGNTSWAASTAANKTAMISGIGNGVATVEASNGTGGPLTGAGASGGANGPSGNYVGLVANSTVGALSVSGSTLSGGANADTVTIGNVTYKFVGQGQATTGNEVAVGNNPQGTLDNLKAAVNAAVAGAGGNGGYYVGSLQSTATGGSAGATITDDTGGVAQIQALTSGNLASGVVLNATFAAGNATGTFGGLTNSKLSGGSSTTAATGTIDLTGQPVAGNATGTISFGTSWQALDGTTVTVNNSTYTFKDTLTGAAGEVNVGGSLTTALTNLQNAVNTGGTSGGNYKAATIAQTGAAISSINTTTGVASIAATALGSAGNNVGLSATAATTSGATLSGGGNSDTVTIGSATYTFVAANAAVSGNTFNEVALGTTLQATLANLQAATQATSGNWTGSGATYHLASSGQVQASDDTGASITQIIGGQAIVTANGNGTAGNSLALSGSLTNGVAGTPGGGVDAGQAKGNLVLTANPTNGNSVTIGSTTYTFTSSAPTAANQVMLGGTITDTLDHLKEAVIYNGTSQTAGYGTDFGTGTVGNTQATMTVSGNQATVTATTAGSTGNGIALSANLTSSAGGGVVGTVNGKLSGGDVGVDLSSVKDAQTALTTIAASIATVASQRGAIGSGINQMNAAVSVMNNTSQNLTSSLSGIQDANIGQVVANMSKYQVLEQTGIAALAQANSQEQAVLKLLG